MRKRSKRYINCLKEKTKANACSLKEALEVLNSMPKANFDETVELVANLAVDPKKSDHMVRGIVNLPNGSGKKIAVLVFTDDAKKAVECGADFAGLDDMIKKVKDGWLDFDVAISTPAAMKEVRTVARILGPRGLMPNPKSGTVSDNIEESIQAVKAGRVEFKMDKHANVAVIVGKRSFEPAKLEENILKAVEEIMKSKPSSLKGIYINSMTISSTASPGISLEDKLFTES